MGDVASAIVKFVLSIFEGLVGGIFKAVAASLSSVPMFFYMAAFRLLRSPLPYSCL